MKYKFLFFICLLFPFLAQSQSFKIFGTTSALNEGDSIFISTKYPFNAFFSYPQKQDTTLVKNQKFNFSMQSETPEFYLISIKRKDGKKSWKWIFLQPSNTTVLFSDPELKHVLIKGNKSAIDYLSFQEQIDKIKPPTLYFNLFKQYDSALEKNEKIALSIKSRIDSITEIINQKNVVASKEWITVHPSSLLDTNGKIVEKNLSPEQLQRELSILYKKGNKN